jgi:hypothetical protein
MGRGTVGSFSALKGGVTRGAGDAPLDPVDSLESLAFVFGIMGFEPVCAPLVWTLVCPLVVVVVVPAASVSAFSVELGSGSLVLGSATVRPVCVGSSGGVVVLACVHAASATSTDVAMR